MGKVTQADEATLPRLHQRSDDPEGPRPVKVTGSYVHDVEGGHGWMEIHPVTSIEPAD